MWWLHHRVSIYKEASLIDESHKRSPTRSKNRDLNCIYNIQVYDPQMMVTRRSSMHMENTHYVMPQELRLSQKVCFGTKCYTVNSVFIDFAVMHNMSIDSSLHVSALYGTLFIEC